jgi:ribose-phosphate pyrophosphokinase
MDQLQIFTGTANPKLAADICTKLDIRPGGLVIRKFADEEIFVQVTESVRGKDAFVVQPTCRPGSAHLLELLIIIDALKRASAGRITAVVPYFGYARQDRKDQPRVAITAKLIANLLTTAGADRVLSMDLHAAQIQGFFDIPVDHLTGTHLFREYIIRQKLECPVIVSPDVGGVVRARQVLEGIHNSSLVIIDKRRPRSNMAEVMNVIGEVKGCDLVIVDDLIDTAGTLKAAARALVDKGARSVRACATHGVLSGAAFENIAAAPIDKVVVTDTIPVMAPADSKIEILSVADMFASAIQRIHLGQSVGAMFSK